QFQEKEGQLKAQLHTLMTLLPTLHVHFMTSAAFSSSANRFEFLDLAYVMMGRLKAITRQPHPLHPLQTSIIDTDFKGQFASFCAQCLRGRCTDSRMTCPLCGAVTTLKDGASLPAADLLLKFMVESSLDERAQCANCDNDLLVKCEKLKIRVQELQRDLTLRRCLTRNDDVSTIRCNIEEIDKHLANHYSNIDNKQSTLQEHWEDSLQRIGNEQELYQAQLQDITRLQHECQHLNTIMKQLSSFVLSITAVTERIDPKLSHVEQDKMHALLEEINAVQPDSQQRVWHFYTSAWVRIVSNFISNLGVQEAQRIRHSYI
ncbi:hypothetical protein LOTGIDRAFT_176050, partial [Lottia gigantea]